MLELSHCHTIYCTVSNGSVWVRGNSNWGMGPDFDALNSPFADNTTDLQSIFK